MITIYRDTWNGNAAAFCTMTADDALQALRSNGWQARIIDGQCANENVGVETDDDRELEAVEEFCSNAPRHPSEIGN